MPVAGVPPSSFFRAASTFAFFRDSPPRTSVPECVGPSLFLSGKPSPHATPFLAEDNSLLRGYTRGERAALPRRRRQPSRSFALQFDLLENLGRKSISVNCVQILFFFSSDDPVAASRTVVPKKPGWEESLKNGGSSE